MIVYCFTTSSDSIRSFHSHYLLPTVYFTNSDYNRFTKSSLMFLSPLWHLTLQVYNVNEDDYN